MKAWLCLNPVRLEIIPVGGKPIAVTAPPESMALLGVYKTKKLARSVHGPKAVLQEVDWEGPV